MKIKILVLSLVVATLSIVSSVGTLAYLKDEQYSTATFTTGQVKVRNRTASIPRETTTSDAQYSTVTTVATDAEIISSAESYSDGYFREHCTEMLTNDTCNKYTYVENTGTVDAYVRVRVLVPKSLISGESPTITLNKNTASTEYTTVSYGDTPCEVGSSEMCEKYIFTRNQILHSGELTTNPVIESITYNAIASTQTEGVNEEATSQTLDLTNSPIKVYTEAIQAQGFATANLAFANFTN